jgi:hypothetical protein
MSQKHLIPAHIQALFPVEVIRAAEVALQSYTIPSPVLVQDIKNFASKVQEAGVRLNTVIKRNMALKVAAPVLVDMPWQKAEKSLKSAAPEFAIALYILGGEHRPQLLCMSSLGEMVDAAIKQIQELLPASACAVIDVERSPFGLTLTATDLDSPSFVIECRAPFTPNDHVRFTYRLIEQLSARAPAVLVNNALLASHAKHNASTEVFFELVAGQVGYRSGRLVGELGLFEQLEIGEVTRDEHNSAGLVAPRAGALNLKAGFRSYDEPWPRDYRPVSDAQIDILFARYTTWRSAVSDFRERVALLNERRRKTPLMTKHAASHHGEMSSIVHVSACLPITLALGDNFITDMVQRDMFTKTSHAVREATLDLIPAHTAALKAKLETQFPGKLARLNEHQHAVVQLPPRQMMGIFADSGEVALGYWEHCKEVVGPSGRFTAKEYGARISDTDLTHSLRRDAIKTAIPCPMCGKGADVSVTMLPSAQMLGVWSLTCQACGHAEEVRDAPDAEFKTSAPAVTCTCNSCKVHGADLFKRHGTAAAKFSENLDRVLVEAAEHLVKGKPGWELSADKTVRLGADLSGRYSEAVFSAGGTSRQERFYSLMPQVAKDQMRNGGLNSALLERDHGYGRQLSYCAIRPFFDASQGWVLSISTARMGFDPADPQSFRRWASHVVDFALQGTMVLPVLITTTAPELEANPSL